MSVSCATVHVSLLDRSYDIEIGAKILGSLADKLTQRRPLTHAVLIADNNTKPYAEEIARNLESEKIRASLIVVAAGEPSKSVAQLHQIWEQLLEFKTDRKSVVLAVGGGVVGDLAGFAAASFARGLDFVQVPTSLLAHVDSSVGGKVGINLSSAKNMVGHFWQPKYVMIDTDVINTLPEREFQSGMAEVVKYGVILDADFFNYLEKNVDAINDRNAETMAFIIRRSCELKAYVVEKDERETTGLRACLNYGHTFAHAFESTCGYGELLHGEAVSIGMLCASRLAESLGRIDSATTARQKELLKALGLPIETPQADVDQFIQVMQSDKKVEFGKLRFILPTKIGHVELVSDVDMQLVRSAFFA